MDEGFCFVLSIVEKIVDSCNTARLKETEMVCEMNREINDQNCKTAAFIAVAACATAAGTVCGVTKIISGRKSREAVKSIEETKHMEEDARYIENN